jgi:hypothetical protein
LTRKKKKALVAKNQLKIQTIVFFETRDLCCKKTNGLQSRAQGGPLHSLRVASQVIYAHKVTVTQGDLMETSGASKVHAVHGKSNVLSAAAKSFVTGTVGAWVQV